VIVGAGIVVGVLTAVQVGAVWAGRRDVRSVAKLGASLAFVAFAVALRLGDAAPGRWVLAGLVLSVLGDALLISQDKRIFGAGIGAFLLAHLAYVGAFAASGISAIGFGLALLAFAPIGVVIDRWLGDGPGKLSPAVRAYITVITVMVAASFGVVAGGHAGMGLVVTAITFWLSDLFVARERFVAPGPWNPTIGLPLYYGAQLGFGWCFAGGTA
jgi:uncharacterized membrane protein YhhN